MDCTTVLNNNGARNSTACRCRYGYLWNQATLQCDPVCSTLRYGVSADGNGGCVCQSRFNWDATLKKCSIDCTQYPAAKINTEPEDSNKCKCPDHFEWTEERGAYNSLLLGCKAICKEFSYSKNTSNPDNISCVCLNGFNWNAILYRCEISCSGQYNTGFTSSQTSCKCVTNTYWNSTTKVCELICKKISNSNGAPAVNGVCVCKLPYVWNSTTRSCVKVI